MVNHSSIPAWRNPRTDEPGSLQSMGSQIVRYNRVTNMFTHSLLYKIQEDSREKEAILPQFKEAKFICMHIIDSLSWYRS